MPNQHARHALLITTMIAAAMLVLLLGTGPILAQEQPVGVSPPEQVVPADQEPAPVLDGVGLAAATSVTATVPPTATLGSPFMVTASVSPRNGPLPIEWEVGGSAFGWWNENGGYSASTTLYSSRAGLQTISISATQGITTLKTSRDIQIVGPSAVSLDAPNDTEVGQPMTLTARLLGWEGAIPVQWTVSVSETFFDAYPASVHTTIVVTPTTTGDLRFYAEGCVFEECREAERIIHVRPPQLKVSWSTDHQLGAPWGDKVTLYLSRLLVQGEAPVKVKVSWNPESDLPEEVTITATTSFAVWYDNSSYRCGRTIRFEIIGASGAMITKPDVLILDTPGVAGVGGMCRVFLPVVSANAPVEAPTPTPVPTNTPTVTNTPGPNQPTATPTNQTTPIATPTRQPLPGGYQIRVNSGGGNVLIGGAWWFGDKPLNQFPYGWGYLGGENDNVIVNIENTTAQELYRNARKWPSGLAQPGYRFTVPSGHYRVLLKLAELHYDGAGLRVFDVVIEGVTYHNWDIYAMAGNRRFYAVEVSVDVFVADGELDIGFVGQLAPGEPAYSRDQPLVNGVSIIQLQL